MKKKLTLVIVLLLTNTILAQKKSMLGTWQEVKYTFMDTTDYGRDLLNSDYENYRSGQKTLDKKYISFREGFNQNLIIEIFKIKNQLYLVDEQKNKVKIDYYAEDKKNFVNFMHWKCEITIDKTTGNLVLSDKGSFQKIMEFKPKTLKNDN